MEKLGDIEQQPEPYSPTLEPRPRFRFCLLLQALVPTFLKAGKKATRKNGIAALDGFRGLACLAVFNEHFVILFQQRRSQHWINRVPFIRLWRYGHGAVFVFFIISGYVLTCKPLKQIRAKDLLGFQKTMSSSILRRGFRLYIPCLIVSTLMVFLTLVGYFDWPMETFNKFYYITFIEERPPQNDLTFAEHLSLYWNNVAFIFCSTFPFEIALGEHSYYEYDAHQWTIPVEFRGSIAIFTALVGTSRMRTSWRMCSHLIMFYYLYNTGRVYVSLFFAGMICAEFDLVRQAYNAKSSSSTSFPLRPATNQSLNYIRNITALSSRTTSTLYILTFILGCWIMSSPNEYLTAGNWLPWALSGFQDFYDLNAYDTILATIGSIMTVWTVANCSALGVIFNHPFVQYLGNISYALYLVHGTVIRSLGYVWLPAALRIATLTPLSVDLTPTWWAQDVSNAECVVAWCIGITVTGAVVFWWADLFWTYVDTPVVKFARWVETKTIVGGDDDARLNSGESRQ